MDIPPFNPSTPSPSDAASPSSVTPRMDFTVPAGPAPPPSGESSPPPPPATAAAQPPTAPPAAPKKIKRINLLMSAIIFLVTFGIFVLAVFVRQSVFTTQNDATTSACVLHDSNIILVIDRSSSMNAKESDGRTKLEWAKQSAKTLVDRVAAMNGTSAKIGVVSFGAQGNDGSGTLDSSNNSTLHIAPSSNFAQVKAAIDAVVFVKSGTCIECGLRIGNNQLTAQALNRVVIILSDGKANHNWQGGSSDATSRAIAEANKGRTSGIVYYVLGYGIGSGIDPATLQAIAGKAANYQYKPNAQEWPEAFLTIVDLICGQPSPTPTKVTPSPTPTVTKPPTPTVTNAPSPTPTKSPTPTPNATVTITPTPTICATPGKVNNLRISCPLCQ